MTVYAADGTATKDTVKMPSVLLAPIRNDIVHFVHTSMSKNRRQAYAVSYNTGMQHAAESWGTGRAVARIPRISGGGTSRSGQAAFGNQVRGGRMFAPTKIWRKWHRKINTNQKRFAVASALAASAITSLVCASPPLPLHPLPAHRHPPPPPLPPPTCQARVLIRACVCMRSLAPGIARVYLAFGLGLGIALWRCVATAVVVVVGWLGDGPWSPRGVSA